MSLAGRNPDCPNAPLRSHVAFRTNAERFLQALVVGIYPNADLDLSKVRARQFQRRLRGWAAVPVLQQKEIWFVIHISRVIAGLKPGITRALLWCT